MPYEIIKPCSEDWSKMHPLEGGRFCDKCAKKVHDLTRGQRLPDTGESFCGRILAGRTLSISFKKLLFRQSLVRYFALMFVLLISSKVKAQLNKINANRLLIEKDSEFDDDLVITVSGRLTNEKTGMDIEGAFISLYDSQRNLLKVQRTDSAGNFSFLVLRKSIGDSLFSVKAEYIGMETLEVTNIPVTKKEIKIELKQDRVEYSVGMTVGKVVYPVYQVISGTTSDYRHLPNKDIMEVAKILSNAPLMGR